MATIETGAAPLSLPGGMGEAERQVKPKEALYPTAFDKMHMKPISAKKHQRKRALGPARPGFAFNK